LKWSEPDFGSDFGRKFNCGKCDYVAKTRSTLQCHVKRIHLGIKDQFCKQCNYKAGTQTLHFNNIITITITIAITKHNVKWIHLDIKDQFCKQCNYKAGTTTNYIQSNLCLQLPLNNGHLSTTTGPNPLPY
jgi:hypothetical protein